MKLHHTLLVLLAALSGCQAPPLKPSALQLSGLHNIMVLAVEPPPLEVDPDPIETRQPLYRQSNNWPYDQFLEKKIYRNPGGVLIAGLVSRDDAVTFPACPTADYPANDAAAWEPSPSCGTTGRPPWSWRWKPRRSCRRPASRPSPADTI
ncbi:hypothetical protein, partial [Methylogaea oryzae]|uniref:hypothetical protein n=1 Tax=Methylogaea oryzae TaxID=1295382 RepID=UPI0012E0DA98